MRGLFVVLAAIVVTIGTAWYGPAAVEASSVWACTPVTQASSGSNNLSNLVVYNGSLTTTNVTSKWLTKTGTNLSGVQVPGASAGTLYPGQTGANSVAVSPGNTLIVQWTSPTTNATFDGNVATTIRVVADQPVVVGMQATFGAGATTVPCSPLD